MNRTNTISNIIFDSFANCFLSTLMILITYKFYTNPLFIRVRLESNKSHLVSELSILENVKKRYY